MTITIIEHWHIVDGKIKRKIKVKKC